MELDIEVKKLYCQAFEFDYHFDLLEYLIVRIFQFHGITSLSLEDVISKVVEYAISKNLGPSFSKSQNVAELLDVLNPRVIAPIQLRYRINRIIINDLSWVKLIDPQYWFGDQRLPSDRPPIKDAKCPNYVSKYIYEKGVLLKTIKSGMSPSKGYWFNPKNEKGLCVQPLGRQIISNEGCFITYLIRSCRSFRPHWSESDVKEYEKNILSQIYKVIKDAINLQMSKSVSFDQLIYFTFGKCPLLIDDDLLNVIIKKNSDFIIGNGEHGLAFKVGKAMANGQLYSNRNLNKGLHFENGGELDNEWKTIDDVEDTIEEGFISD